MNTDKKICFVVFLGFLLLFIYSCKEKSPEAIYIQEKHDEIIVIHDEVMPKMRDIYKLKKKIKKDTRYKDSSLIDSLDYAEEIMMEWMHEYKEPSESDPEYEQYLDHHMVEVSKVRDAMLRIIDNSQKALAL